eukprot:scaffold2895_cov140-Skeletonema_menzelii.AAC.7
MAQSIKLSKIDKYYFLSMSNANNSSNGLHIISSSTWKWATYRQLIVEVVLQEYIGFAIRSVWFA